MSNCRLIVCEKTSHWAGVVRPLLRGQQPGVIETRALTECQAALLEAPASLIALELMRHNIERALDFFAIVRQQFPKAAVAVLVAPELEQLSPLMREVGAIDVF